MEKIVDTQTPDGPMAVLHKRLDGDGSCPAVIIFHDGPGIRNATHEFASKLASAGYDVYVPDLYHRQGRMIGYELHEREANPKLVDELWDLLHSLTDDGIQSDLNTVLQLPDIADGQPLGCIGFCVGARAVFRTMMRLPKRFTVGAMWHPSFLADDKPDSPHIDAGAFPNPLYIGVGEDDQIQPVAHNHRFFSAVQPLPEVEVQMFPGVDHAFTWPGWPNYNQHAAEVCFDKTLNLFRRHLPLSQFS